MPRLSHSGNDLGRSKLRKFDLMVIFELILALMVISCNTAKPLVVIEHHHNLESSKVWCDLNPLTCGSADTSGNLLDFESELRTAFATDSICTGVNVATSDRARQRDKDEWSLLMTVDAEKSKQTWRLVHMVGYSASEHFSGDGNAAEIARSACMIVKRTGAAVR
jgi:hypothetical protein